MNELGSLQSASGGEGPAGSTSTLILDRRDSPSGNPIDIVWELQVLQGTPDFLSKGVIMRLLVGNKVHRLAQTKMFLKLIIGHIGVLIMAKSELGSWLLVVVLFNKFCGHTIKQASTQSV